MGPTGSFKALHPIYLVLLSTLVWDVKWLVLKTMPAFWPKSSAMCKCWNNVPPAVVGITSSPEDTSTYARILTSSEHVVECGILRTRVGQKHMWLWHPVWTTFNTNCAINQNYLILEACWTQKLTLIKMNPFNYRAKF